MANPLSGLETLINRFSPPQFDKEGTPTSLIFKLKHLIDELQQEIAEKEFAIDCARRDSFQYQTERNHLSEERTQLEQQLQEAREAKDAAEAKLAIAQKDSARLDKLQALGRRDSVNDPDGDWSVCYSKHHLSLRSAIDLSPDPGPRWYSNPVQIEHPRLDKRKPILSYQGMALHDFRGGINEPCTLCDLIWHRSPTVHGPTYSEEEWTTSTEIISNAV